MNQAKPGVTPYPLPIIVLYGLAALACCALFLFLLTRFHEDISHSRIQYLDQAIPQSIHTRDTPFLTALARTFSFIGSPMILFPAVPIAAAILWVRRLRHDAMLLLLSMAGAGILESIIKLHYRRLRPGVPWAFVHERSFSFPSGHSVLAVVLYGILAFLIGRHLPAAWQRILLLTACIVLILAIGLSRIYLGAHFPSDVLAGYFVGATWLLFVLTADRALSGASSEPSTGTPDHFLSR